MTNKVLVIGLDGTTFDLIIPWVQDGQLPNFQKLMDEGCWGNLESTPIDNSFPGWATLTTGVNPGKHSAFDVLIRKEDSCYTRSFMNSTDVKAKRVWDIFSENDRKVGVFNVPGTYPPSEVNGFLVAGMLTPGPQSEYTYPSSLRDELRSQTGYAANLGDWKEPDREVTLHRLFASFEKRKETTLYLMKKYEWDLLWTVFTLPDRIQHFFWATTDGKHPWHRRERKLFGDAVYRCYRKLDSLLGDILENISDDTQIIIVSDHGFCPFYQTFSTIRWLKEKDLLVMKEKDRYMDPLKSFLKTFGLLGYAKKFEAYFRSMGKRIKLVVGQKRQSFEERVISKVDWSKTKAYSFFDHEIRLNLKGREPDGIVSPGKHEIRLNLKGREPDGIVSPGKEEEDLKENIKEELSNLRFSNGERVFCKVWTKEEVYQGPYVGRTSDIILSINHKKAPTKRIENWRYSSVSRGLTGSHHPKGIFIAKGRGIKGGERIHPAHIRDITPTILYMSGLPLTEDMDGKVLEDIFTKEFLKDHQIKYAGSSIIEESFQDQETYSPEETKKLEEHLRSLGYLD